MLCREGGSEKANFKAAMWDAGEMWKIIKKIRFFSKKFDVGRQRCNPPDPIGGGYHPAFAEVLSARLARGPLVKVENAPQSRFTPRDLY